MTKITVTVVEHYDSESGNSWVEIHCPDDSAKEQIKVALQRQKQALNATSEKLKLVYVFMTAAWVRTALEAVGIEVQINNVVCA